VWINNGTYLIIVLSKVILKFLDLRYGNSFCPWKLNLVKKKEKGLGENKIVG
jgi:hypothetical protein